MQTTTKRKRSWISGLLRRDTLDFERPLRGKGTTSDNAAKLPLVHVTSSWRAREVVKTAKLQVSACEIFGVNLLYFFVMRPAYLGRDAGDKSLFLTHAPVAFVLKSSAVPAPYHIYPFDTGAAARGAFKANADKLIPLEDYELSNDHASALGFVDWAFGDLSSYFDGSLRQELASELRPNDSVEQGYVAIARMGTAGNKKHDTRASTLELTSNHNVDVPGLLDLLIVPKQMLEDNGLFGASIRKYLASGVKIEAYDWRPNSAPAEYQRDMMRITRDWYRSKKYNV